MAWYSREGLRFWFDDQGTGVPFFFGHGLGADSAQTLEFFPPPPGIRLIRMDFRGHGRTEPLGKPEDLRLDVLADDVAALLAARGVSEVVWGGISLGAAVAVQAAVRHRGLVQGLVLVRPAFLFTSFPQHLQYFALAASHLVRFGREEGKRRLAATAEFALLKRQSSTAAASLLKQFDQDQAVERAERLDRLVRHVPASAEEVSTISVPTLIVGNRDDPIHPWTYAWELTTAIAGARLAEIPAKNKDLEAHFQRGRGEIAQFLAETFSSS